MYYASYAGERTAQARAKWAVLSEVLPTEAMWKP